MHIPTRTAKIAAPRRRFAVATLVATAAAISLAAGPATAAPPHPAEIAGDHHSPAVSAAAAGALESFGAYTSGADVTRLIRFIGTRNAVADVVAREYGVDPAVVRQAWARADHRHQVAVLAALSQLGVSYQSNSSEPGVSFDCSGLTTYAWGRAGVTLYRQSGVQLSNASSRDASSAVAGDLVGYPGHVMMYLGFGGAIVHASNPENDVELSTLHDDRSYDWGDPTG